MRTGRELAFPAGTSIPLTTMAREGAEDYEMANDDITKAAVIYMLERGLAHPVELERLSKRSKQIIRIWLKEHPNARADYLKRKWEKALAIAEKRALSDDKNR